MTFEQVVTGYSDQGDPNSWMGGENNAFRGSGTLGIALRKYSEGAGFTPAKVYDSPFFFMGDTQLVPNSGQLTANSIHGNLLDGGAASTLQRKRMGTGVWPLATAAGALALPSSCTRTRTCAAAGALNAAVGGASFRAQPAPHTSAMAVAALCHELPNRIARQRMCNRRARARKRPPLRVRLPIDAVPREA